MESTEVHCKIWLAELKTTLESRLGYYLQLLYER